MQMPSCGPLSDLVTRKGYEQRKRRVAREIGKNSSRFHLRKAWLRVFIEKQGGAKKGEGVAKVCPEEKKAIHQFNTAKVILSREQGKAGRKAKKGGSAPEYEQFTGGREDGREKTVEKRQSKSSSQPDQQINSKGPFRRTQTRLYHEVEKRYTEREGGGDSNVAPKLCLGRNRAGTKERSEKPLSLAAKTHRSRRWWGIQDSENSKKGGGRGQRLRWRVHGQTGRNTQK